VNRPIRKPPLTTHRIAGDAQLGVSTPHLPDHHAAHTALVDGERPVFDLKHLRFGSSAHSQIALLRIRNRLLLASTQTLLRVVHKALHQGTLMRPVYLKGHEKDEQHQKAEGRKRGEHGEKNTGIERRSPNSAGARTYDQRQTRRKRRLRHSPAPSKAVRLEEGTTEGSGIERCGR